MSDYVAGGRRVSDVPRTTDAEGTQAVVAAAAARGSRPAAFWGMLILIASEATLFGCMVGTYFYFRFHTVAWPPDGIPKPELATPIVLTAVLALTSVPLWFASRAGGAGRLGPTRLAILVAMLVQAGYLAYEIHDYRDQLQTFEVTRNAYSSIYYTMIGADHAHVLVGLLFEVWLLSKLLRGLTTYRLNALRAITWYWYAVILITIVVVGTTLSAAA